MRRPGRSPAERSEGGAYVDFVRAHVPPARDPFYTDEIVRFELRPGDVLALPGDVRVEPGPEGVVLESRAANASTTLHGVSPGDATRLLGLIDGARTVAELRATDSLGVFQRLVDACFGKLLFAPFAVMDLERRLSAREIVRYPGSPYEVLRAYWENQIDVATHLAGIEERAGDAAHFPSLLSALHRLALTGATGRSFYVPNSPIVRKSGVLPGEVFDEPPVLDETGPEIVFVSGPRVGAGLIGGPLFQELFAELSGDPGSRFGALTFRDEQGVPWGRVVTARAETDLQALPWFCPPRPISEAHLARIHGVLTAALAARVRGDSGALVAHVSHFHQAFMRLHPFAAGNQSVAMSIVNHLLRTTFGAGIPHLVLDHVALRLSPDAYARVFALAVKGWLVTEGSPAERTLKLVAKKRAVFGLFRELSRTEDLEGARAVAREHRDAARLALLAVD